MPTAANSSTCAGRAAGRAKYVAQLVDASGHVGVAVLGEVARAARRRRAGRDRARRSRRGCASPSARRDRREQRARPRHAALEEPDAQLGEPVRDAGEEQRLAQRLVRRGEPVHVVVHVVRDRPGDAVLLQRAVHDGRDAELHALGPQRVVVVVAVEAEHVEAVPAGARSDGVRSPRSSTDFAPSSLTAYSTSATACAGCSSGSARRRCSGRGTARTGAGGSGSPRGTATDESSSSVDLEVPERHRRVQDREVDADLVEPLVEQRGQVRRGAVAHARPSASPTTTASPSTAGGPRDRPRSARLDDVSNDRAVARKRSRSAAPPMSST